MASKEYATSSAVRPGQYGEITASVEKILSIRVTTTNIEMDHDVQEVHLYINGRKIKTMSPQEADRMGLVITADKW